jgi:hypothetical protein
MAMAERSIDELERRLALIEAKAEIEHVIKSYGRSADRRNVDAFIDSFHPDSTHNHIQYFKGASRDFVQGLAAHHDALFTSHFLSNIEIAVDLDAGAAVTECYFMAAHFVLADARKEAFGGHRVGVDEIWWVGGRYFDRFEKRDGRWRIAHRTGAHDWEHWQEIDARGFKRDVTEVPEEGPFSPGWIRKHMPSSAAQ